MKSQNFAIGMLACTAVLLATAVCFLRTAQAEVAVKDREISVATFPANNGGDALYISNGESVLVLTWDPSSKTVVPRAARHIDDAFNVK